MKVSESIIKTALSGNRLLILVVIACIVTISFSKNAMAQQKNHTVRLATIEVDPQQLEKYETALKEQMAAAIRVEPGVLTYYAVADKTNPAHITILEIYADSAAYKLHTETPHFKKYKQTVQNMVKSLELIDVNLIGAATKPQL